MAKSYLTEEGLKKIQDELEELKTIKRPDVVKRIDIAREFGDLSENAAYHDAKDEQGYIEGRILELEHLIKTSEIVDKNAHDKDLIEIGSHVKVEFDGNEKEFDIVGANEADPIKGLLSYNSPLGESFLGKKTGDKFEVEVPKGNIKCKILEIK
jgi:transcription elongation factor GreA